MGSGRGSGVQGRSFTKERRHLPSSVIVGRRMRRSATRAAIIARALTQPKIRSEGRSDRTVTPKPQASTTDLPRTSLTCSSNFNLGFGISPARGRDAFHFQYHTAFRYKLLWTNNVPRFILFHDLLFYVQYDVH